MTEEPKPEKITFADLFKEEDFIDFNFADNDLPEEETYAVAMYTGTIGF